MRSIWFLILLGSLITYHCLTTVAGEKAPSTDASHKPTAEQCKGYVDAALKTSSPETEGDEASTEDSGEPPDETASSEQDGDGSTEQDGDSKEETASQEDGGDSEGASEEEGQTAEETDGSQEGTAEEESTEDDASAAPDDEASNEESTEATEEDATAEQDGESTEGDGDSTENATAETDADNTQEEGDASTEATEGDSGEATEGESAEATEGESAEATEGESAEATGEESAETTEGDTTDGSQEGDSGEATADEDTATAEEDSGETNSAEQDGGEQDSTEADDTATAEESGEDDGTKSEEDDKSANGDTQEDTGEETESDNAVSGDVADETDKSNESGESQEGEATQEDTASTEDADSPETEAGVSAEDASQQEASDTAGSTEGDSGEEQASAEEQATSGSEEETASEEEEEQEQAEPYEPRSRAHVTQILGLDDSEETQTAFKLLDKVTTTTLKELKNTYENAIKPLEHLYKYRDLSNRHFGDPEIFSKPLIVFMGPWSGGKSTIINWLLGIQHEDIALRTGADPSPAQFNIMMYGKEPEKLDGTQLAADWTFSGLQKFGQSFLDRLRGQKLPNRLLEKVNIVEIPGILEVRKQVERSFPFNDACQWFIDRADTLFLIYDPAKLDIGPETEAILDQLKGRENQVRIVLNKADTVKPDELLRVQAMLVWNISPLMSSAEPPVMYAASLWDHPLQVESPKSLLIAHENNFLKDIRDGIERRVETRIAAARRFAVRVRNHAKMVDCYLNTYNNHRSFFSDRKKISTDIINHPQNYHIYEGLSTLTNISRYDLPDPDTYRDFFRLNSLWDFPTLQSTCSFWRGCPLHKLDIAIAYDLPEILGKFRRQREGIISAKEKGSSRN